LDISDSKALTRSWKFTNCSVCRKRHGDSKAWRDTFADALHQFHRCRFDAAEAAFRRTISLRNEDGPSQFYLQRITDMRRQPPSPDWTGEIELRDK
jgi:hypothetical protein